MAIAHIRNGVEINRYPDSGKGWATLENGNRVSPVVVGSVYGNDKFVPVVDEFQDTSTGNTRTTTSDTGWTVEADRVYRLVTKRDMTAQELAAVVDQENTAGFGRLDNRPELKVIGAALWHIYNGSAPAGMTVPQFKTWLRSLL